MKHYDDNESDTPGDPTLDDVNPGYLKALQVHINDINKIKNPIVKAKLVENLVSSLNG